MKQIINYLGISIVFSAALVVKSTFFDLYLYYILIIAFLPLLFLWTGIKLPKFFLVILFLFGVIGVFKIYFNENTFSVLLKQEIGILLVGLFFYYLLKLNEFNYLKLFRVYLNLATAVAVIGLTQFIAFYLSIKNLYDLSWVFPTWRLYTYPSINIIRINSVLPEPSHYCISMMPAFFVSVYNVLNKDSPIYIKRTSRWLIISTFFMTLSTLGFVGIALSILLITLKKIRLTYLAYGLTLGVLFLVLSYKYSEFTKSRLEGLYETFVEGKVNGRTNISAYVMYNNFNVTLQTIKESPIFGSGLGSYAINFDKYGIRGIYGRDSIHDLNRTDANSLFFRIVAECGIVGLIFMTYFILNNFITKNTFDDKVYWLVCNSILSVIFLKLFRDGHYFVHGFPFFLWLYYLNNVKFLESKRIKNNES